MTFWDILSQPFIANLQNPYIEMLGNFKHTAQNLTPYKEGYLLTSFSAQTLNPTG